MKNPVKACLLVAMLTGASATSMASERMEDGREAYQAACAKCHEEGVDGAPKTGELEDWSNRSHLWEAVLFEHANQGYLNMPAKGGTAELPAYDVDAAAEYMLGISHPDMPLD